MYDFNSNNKLPGVYWLKQPIDDLKLKIKIKPKASAINLPKYEEFMNISTTADLDKIETEGIDEYVFKWQEKVFSAWEIKTYSDVHNCGTETQLDHLNALNTKEYKPQKVFTYIHEDSYLPVPLDLNKFQNQRSNFNLLSCFESLSLKDRFSKSFGGSSSLHQLFRSQESVIEKSSWISMHVVFDDTTYTNDTQLLIKQEYILLSLYYNITANYLIISPDVNNLVQNPYNVSTENCSANFEYGVEIIFDESESDQDLVNLLNKLYIKWQKKHKQMVKFIPAPTGKEKFHVNIEIVSANDFDMDNIYIEYEIKIPENFKCEDILHGRTHISKANNGDRFWTYGQIIELDIENDEEIELSPLQLYLEAISSDWWGRQRTEGYCYLPLWLIPGFYNKVLTCSRPEEVDKVEASTRRFFVGGCHLIKDLEVLSKPQLQNTNFTYTETGNINLRYSVIRQVNSSVEVAAASSSSGSALLQRAELVLREYSRAAASLAAAIKHIDSVYT